MAIHSFQLNINCYICLAIAHDPCLCHKVSSPVWISLISHRCPLARDCSLPLLSSFWLEECFLNLFSNFTNLLPVVRKHDHWSSENLMPPHTRLSWFESEGIILLLPSMACTAGAV